jgi:cobalt transporter subunit CbtB
MQATTGRIFPAAAAARALPDARTWSAALVAGLLGLFLLYGVGFANPATLHHAAHDARHAFAFPCH